MQVAEKLAVHGGKPLRTDGWAKWPDYSDDTIAMIMQALSSRRWAVSGPYNEKELFERKFARAFADFCGASYCVPCDHGSSALLIALEALDIGYGDEVLIPALTWVATATAVVNVNAIPVLVDVDPATLCMDPEKAAAAITPRTKAIMPVHLYSGMCNMDALTAIAAKYNIPIIEDCAHVHGAKWGDRFAGTIGSIGAFSMQQGKGLTAGEGGAVLTNDDHLYERLQQLRADSRKYSDQQLKKYDMELAPGFDVQGTNFCISEIQSAILCSQLPQLQHRINVKARNAAILDEGLADAGGLSPLTTYPQVTQRAYYCYALRADRDAFGGMAVADICGMLKAELNIPFFTTYEPLNQVQSYKPASKKRNNISQEHLRRLDLSQYHLPVASKAFEECICMPHWVLTGSEKDMHDIIKAYKKIKLYASS